MPYFYNTSRIREMRRVARLRAYVQSIRTNPGADWRVETCAAHA